MSSKLRPQSGGGIDWCGRHSRLSYCGEFRFRSRRVCVPRPEDVHDHISAIEVSGTGSTRRVRIAFETQAGGGQAEYPRCETLEAKLIGQFGRPQTVRRFMEEASPRADRIWRSQTEELTLICFAERGRLWAEAVIITPR
jgi:hypothetical protein